MRVTSQEKADLPNWTRYQSPGPRMETQRCHGAPEAEAAVPKAVQKLINQPKIWHSPEIYPGAAVGEMAACEGYQFNLNCNSARTSCTKSCQIIC